MVSCKYIHTLYRPNRRLIYHYKQHKGDIVILTHIYPFPQPHHSKQNLVIKTFLHVYIFLFLVRIKVETKYKTNFKSHVVCLTK